jgi:hypothetical protein
MDEDLKDVLAEEGSRGRRPVDIGERKRRLALRRKFNEIVENGDEEQFLHAIIHVLGQLPGSAEYRRSVKAWREYHRMDE